MAANQKTQLDEKWEACLDITLRRSFYSTIAGTLAGLIFFRSPTARWASVAFGAGMGIGSAYSDSSRIFGGSFPNWPPSSGAPSPSSTPSYPSD
ncbi:uncharacterized protein LOC105420699 [Amborella trichopoda]|uniref:uncharacterized protein LOC105420699 n=1 Tax=Amborella trichopoda TaxID=13333 RepID=UPI0005D445BE|nr:uncharacterized protein LOC105420699 [Amborella trichopoda]|eukprot:XP_011623654.1 uncharacterized protein LOC105420699 [Amborella trichopoda]